MRHRSKPTRAQGITINAWKAHQQAQAGSRAVDVKPAKAQGSWWLRYATGPRDDARFMAETTQRHPAGVTQQEIGPMLKDLTR